MIGRLSGSVPATKGSPLATSKAMAVSKNVAKMGTIMGYMLAGLCFNSVSMCHMLDTFHVCYEAMSVNTVELRCVMCNGN